MKRRRLETRQEGSATLVASYVDGDEIAQTTTEKRHAIFARNESALGASLREHSSDIEDGEMDEFPEFIADAENIPGKAETLCWRFNSENRVRGLSNLLSLASRRARTGLYAYLDVTFDYLCRDEGRWGEESELHLESAERCGRK